MAIEAEWNMVAIREVKQLRIMGPPAQYSSVQGASDRLESTSLTKTEVILSSYPQVYRHYYGPINPRSL